MNKNKFIFNEIELFSEFSVSTIFSIPLYGIECFVQKVR